MPKEQNTKSEEKPLIDSVSHSEYCGVQDVFDDLYAKSKNGEKFTNLMKYILLKENILLAYKNIKSSKDNHKPGIDKLTINSISKLTANEVVNEVITRFKGTKKIGYKPQPVKRKEILKRNGSIRSLGIPCIWDALIQQCIKQVLEPICEAKFSIHSHGFRPMRTIEHAIADLYKYIQLSNLYQVIEINIDSFFDEVNHSKLIRQLWSLGIRDTKLIYRIKSILKSPIKISNGEMIYPTKGIYQCGILTPLFTNIVLNELDHWIESQWIEHPITKNYKCQVHKSGSLNKTHAYRAMRKTNLKEMYIVRYADDFRILCRTRNQANRTKIAVEKWLKERLKLEVSPDRTKVVNIKRNYLEFLGFKVKVKPKYDKYVVTSHISNEQLKIIRKRLTDQAKKIARPKGNKNEYDYIREYNSMVLSIQDYYRFATDVNIDLNDINRNIMIIFTNRLKGRLAHEGRKLTPFEQARFGASKMIRYIKGSGIPIYPIGFIQNKKPMMLKYGATPYSPEGREKLHCNLLIDENVDSNL